MRLTRIFSGLHTQSRQLAWAANWAILNQVHPVNLLERQLCTEGIGQLSGQTRTHTTEGGDEPWQDHVQA